MNPKKLQETSYGVIPLKKVAAQWQVLLIQMNAGHWSFPKGHPEIGESALETARRELFEETRLSISRVLVEVPFEENYQFTKNTNLINKKVFYFLAEVSGNVTVQKEEIQAFKWISPIDAINSLTFLEDKILFKQILFFLS
ncbi:MAG: hypothetical protein CK425_01650 [Parachlamydia sp.]|nr:MAG: hypothetical protein CK425_01650 [Parachlamydia sp.]